jgi:hypothetical protein
MAAPDLSRPAALTPTLISTSLPDRRPAEQRSADTNGRPVLSATAPGSVPAESIWGW